jgi:high affinity sulfate transporter 1
MKVPAKKQKTAPGFGMLQGILPVTRAQVPLDVIAGITLAALAIPEVMGYAKIAGMPIVSGLYTLLIPMAVFALFCSSRHLIVGADSATAAILAASLVALAVPGTPHYVALAGMVALLAGVFLLAARLFRLGFIVDFLSRTVLIGFLTGVGLQVALGQVPGIFDVPKKGDFLLLQVANIATEINLMHAFPFFIACLVIIVILLGDRFMRRVPWALIMVICAIIASWAWDFTRFGATVVGNVPGGLPQLGVPAIPPAEIPSLFGLAVACFIVILAQSAATSRAYATRYSEKFNEGNDLVGLSFANFAAGFSGTFVVSGSPTKTEMVDSAGGKTQLAQLVTVGVVLLVLLFLTGPLAFLPNAVLAAIVFTIGIRLIDIHGMKGILDRRPVEFVVALATTISVVLFGVGWGIVFAILFSIIAHLRHGYHPRNFLMFRNREGKWMSTPVSSGEQAEDGLLMYRFGADLYYANEGRMSEEVLEVVRAAKTPVKWFCFSASSVNDIDYSGSEALRQLHGDLSRMGITLVISHLEDHVRAELERDTLTTLIGKDHIFLSKDDVVAAYTKWHAGAGAGSPPVS